MGQKIWPRLVPNHTPQAPTSSAPVDDVEAVQVLQPRHDLNGQLHRIRDMVSWHRRMNVKGLSSHGIRQRAGKRACDVCPATCCQPFSWSLVLPAPPHPQPPASSSAPFLPLCRPPPAPSSASLLPLLGLFPLKRASRAAPPPHSLPPALSLILCPKPPKRLTLSTSRSARRRAPLLYKRVCRLQRHSSCEKHTKGKDRFGHLCYGNRNLISQWTFDMEMDLRGTKASQCCMSG